MIILMSWAVHLSGYAMPLEHPEIQFRPHSFFVENACPGMDDCKVLGWYDDTGIIYIDYRLQKGLDNGISSSLIVHEFVHYLQPKYMDGCKRQAEANAVQNLYIEQVLTTNYRVPFIACAS